MRARSVLPLLAAGAIVVAAASCGSKPSATAGQTVARVKERDFRIQVSPSRLPAGAIRFVIDNAGPSDHELIMVRAVEASLPLRADGLTVNENALEPETIVNLEPVSPGTVRDLRLHLKPGRYEVFCNMEGHFMGGMRAFFTVV